MCGIAGIYSLSGQPVDASSVQGMCDLMQHRGPDDAGLWSAGPVALGHRRLSIIDLSARGHNPMPNEDETVWIVFNGEIYNYRELRRDLLARGHRFRSESDTEVIVHLYEEYGPACVAMLNGMFAFAVFDQRRQFDRKRSVLFLARDRFGVKPLYFLQMGDLVAFASEIKAFLAVPGFDVRPDVVALAEHFTFQNTLGDRTFFQNVQLLPAGYYLMCEEGRVQRRQYWDLQFEPNFELTLEDWAAGLRERFEAAVSRQLMSDVPLGTYLSGGMDTGAISAVAARQIPGMHTFTCGFDVPGDAAALEKFFDERSESRALARHLGTDHHEVELGPDAMMPVLPHLVWQLDEPRVGISYPVLYTAQTISRYVTVVLSGVGGDELFGGYPWRYEPMLSVGAAEFDETYYQSWIRLLTDEGRQRLFTPELNHELGGFSTFDSFREVLKGTDETDPLHRALYFDFKTFLNGLLVVDDKLNMAHGVEGRVPFLDNELVDYVSRIPSKFKLSAGHSKTVLRAAMKGLLPAEVLSRRKQGFTPPDRTWYKRHALAYVRETILGPRALDRGYFEPASVKSILDDHLADRCDNRFLIWSLMCTEWWHRLFVDREPIIEAAHLSAVSASK